MLQINVIGKELFDDVSQEFIYVDSTVLRLEHSLVSISKWEAKWKKPFIDRKGHSDAEMRDYIRCMTLNQHVNPNVYMILSPENIKAVTDYIEDSHTATWFREQDGRGHNREIVTSEVVYSWLVAYRIPFDPCQKWHFNRLMTLIRICSIQNGDNKKMSTNAILSRNRALNAARRSKIGTKG